MELFKFVNTIPTNLVNAEYISGYNSAMWVERYREPGEFELIAPLSSGLKEFLPLGTIISHIDTLEAAIVETHHIKENVNSDPIITISGRTFDSFLENRIVGTNQAWGDAAVPFTEYSLSAANTWNQAVTLINQHILSTLLIDDNESLNDNILAATVTPGTGVSETRIIKRGSVHARLMELLAVDNLGIRFIRRNPFGVFGDDVKSYFLIHHGNDKRDTVNFSWTDGELKGAEYLWSLKKSKNIALVQGRYVEEIVYSSANHYDRRIMFVDANDIDGYMTTVPTISTTPTIGQIRAKMYIRGQEALANQNEVNIASTDISDVSQYQYRKDYDIGDIVSVDGNYGGQEQRRVIEYVEIEDEHGESGHPTLAVLNE